MSRISLAIESESDNAVMLTDTAAHSCSVQVVSNSEVASAVGVVTKISRVSK